MIQVPDQASLHSFSTNIHTVQQILEEAARLLKLLWRVSLPLKAVHGTTHGTQVLLCCILRFLGWVFWWVFFSCCNMSGKMHQLGTCHLGKSFENHEPSMPSLWTHGFSQLSSLKAKAECVLAF